MEEPVVADVVGEVFCEGFLWVDTVGVDFVFCEVCAVGASVWVVVFCDVFVSGCPCVGVFSAPVAQECEELEVDVVGCFWVLDIGEE